MWWFNVLAIVNEKILLSNSLLHELTHNALHFNFQFSTQFGSARRLKKSSFSGKFYLSKVNMFAKKLKKEKEKREDRQFFCASITHCAFGLPTALHHSAASRSVKNLFSQFHHTFMCRQAAVAHQELKYSGCHLFSYVIQCCEKKWLKTLKHYHNVCKSTAPGCCSSLLASYYCYWGMGWEGGSSLHKKKKKKWVIIMSPTRYYSRLFQKPLFSPTTPCSFIFHQASLLIKMLNGTL